MANPSSPYEVTTAWHDPRSVYWSSHYLKKLLIERHAIRASLEHPGGSIITAGPAQAADAENLPSYSSVVGNDFHLDLLEAEREVNILQPRDRIELLGWCDGLSPREAAQWANLKGGKIRSTLQSTAKRRIHENASVVAAEAERNEVPA
jgi:hypothetical protein